MSANITIKDIARLTGFSKSTVSRVLNDDPLVKEDTRDKILKTAQLHNYKKNELARGMVLGSLNIVMIIAGDISNYFYGAAVNEIQKILYDAGYLVMMCTSEYDAKKELSYLDMAENFRIAGAILLSAIESEELRAKLEAASFPVLLMNRYLTNCETDAVVQDNFRCAYLATRYLIENGHRRILHISSGRGATTSTDRRQGFIAAMRDSGLDVGDDMIIFGDLSWAFGYSAARKLHDERRFTAVFIGNDMMTVGFAKGWKDAGGSIPGDISLVCFDSSPFIDQLSVKISTVGCTAAEIGRRTGEFFLSHTLKRLKPEKLIIEPVYSWRSSVTDISSTDPLLN